MAEFQEQVMGLTGLTIDNSSTNPSRAEFTTFLTDGAKEIINILPKKLKEKCITETILSNSPTSMDVDGFGDITSVVRRNSDSGYWISCRKVSKEYSSSATDSTSLHYATETDPVYYIEPQASPNALKVRILPTSSANVAKVIHLDYPAFVTSGGQEYDITTISTIHNFPDEAEYLVVIRAAIFAGQYLLAIEQDEDLYEPIIEGLEKRYKQGIDALQTKKIDAAPTKSKVPGKGGMDISKLLQGLKGKK